MKTMKYRSITKRWFFDVASIVLIILVVASFSAFMIVRNYYYGAAEMTVESISSEEIASIFSLYGASNSGFESAARDYVENFSEKDKMAVWVINSNGRVVVSSSGFSINDEVEMPDFTMAVTNTTGSARWTGKLPSGERIMAYTCAYRYSDGELGGAIRYMVSLDALDEQLAIVAIMIIFITAIMFIALTVSGLVFVRSIITPVKDIGATAKKIAGGDLSASIDHYPFNDEIGELCTTINDMADKLAESDRMKNDFISTVSHELRTPLTAIRGWGETISQIGESDPGMTKRGMEIIISEASRLNDMVEELLDFSRVNSGRMKLKEEKVDFLAELDDVLFTFKDRAIREGIEITYSVPKTPAPGTGDSARIKQVYINILDNAVKYTEQGGKINVEAVITDKTLLTVSFSDTGAGIKPEDLPHVKEKFYKANTTVRGSGIGLAVCDEIMKLHGGTLEIDSVYGQGTTVTVTLPLDPPAASVKESTNE